MTKLRILSLFMASIIVPSPLFSQTPPPAGGPTEKTLTASAPKFTFYGKIEEARELLRSIPLSHSSKLVAQVQYINIGRRKRCRKCRARVVRKKVIKYTDYTRKEAALALLNTKTSELATAKIEKNNKELVNLSPKFNIIFEERHSGITWNGKNTAFHVTLKSTNEQLVVVGIKWIEKIDGYDSEDVLYVPYSRALHQQELVELGRAHYNALTESAYKELDRLNVHSLAFPEKKVTEVVPQHFPIRKGIDEHTDPTEFDAFMDGELKEDPFERVFVRLGTNREKEFANTKSKAAARGLKQFINGTWNIMRTTYPAARLPDFITGTANQVISTEAAVLLDDYNLWLLMNSFGPSIAYDPQLELYLAAGYNGGIGRVIRGLKRSKLGWRDKLMPETKDYLEKLDYLIVQDLKKTAKPAIPTKTTS